VRDVILFKLEQPVTSDW